MKKGDHTYNVSNGQVNINHGSGTINANYTINKGTHDISKLQDALQQLQDALEQEKNMGFIVKNSVLSETQSVTHELQNNRISKSKLQKFRDFLSNCLPELQAFSAICAAISTVKDVIDMNFVI